MMRNDHLMMQLSDGRQLGYAEYGDSAGHPVFYFQGSPGSRLQAADFHALACVQHYRLLSVDRPGMGLSSFNTRHTILNWANDISELADALDIKQFSIIAHSGGASFALACAYAIPDCVIEVAIVSGLAPTNLPESKRGMARGFIIMNSLMRNIPGFAWLMMKLQQVFVTPELLKKNLKHLPEPDQIIFEDPACFNSLIATTTEAFKQGASGPAQEMRLVVKPWGFNLENIDVPISVFQGKLDSQVPVSHAEIFRDRLPNARLRFFEEEAHLSALYNHAEEIFEPRHSR
tara:strand:- start:55103 stop:55969 length:867 start_codon:yes stop_codon:yes gene_type:complete